MRSDLVFSATAYISNRFLLSKLAAKATRKFHRPNTRIQETMNDVFVRFGRSNPIAVVPTHRHFTSVPLRRASGDSGIAGRSTSLRINDVDRMPAEYASPQMQLNA
jgi:hypothetical protein